MSRYEEAYKKAHAAKTTVNVLPEFKEWKEDGDHITGRFMGVQAFPGRKPDTTFNKYTFDTDQGLVSFTLGAMIDGQVKTCMQVGNVYRIAYRGQKELPNGNSMNSYDIELVPGMGRETVNAATGEVVPEPGL